jgi:hypothetical protein
LKNLSEEMNKQERFRTEERLLAHAPRGSSSSKRAEFISRKTFKLEGLFVAGSVWCLGVRKTEHLFEDRRFIERSLGYIEQEIVDLFRRMRKAKIARVLYDEPEPLSCRCRVRGPFAVQSSLLKLRSRKEKVGKKGG